MKTKRRFLLSATIAAALHVGLLVVGSAGARPVQIEGVGVTIKCGRPVQVEFEAESEQEYASEGFSHGPGLLLDRPQVIVPEGGFIIDVPSQPRIEPIICCGGIPNCGFSLTSICGGGVPIGGVLDGRMLDSAPRVVSQAVPVYPYWSRVGGGAGRVVVEFIVDENGSVVESRVMESSDAGFNETAQRAVLKWKFEPGKRAGESGSLQNERAYCIFSKRWP